MKRSLRTSACLWLVLLVAALVGTSFASVQGTFERTLTVSGGTELEVFTHSGDITVHSGSSGSVVIRGKITVGTGWFSGDRQADVNELEKNPPIHQSGNTVRIDYTNVRNVAIDYDITVPSDTKVRSHSGSGEQDIEGLTPYVELESGSGDVRISTLGGGVHLRTGSGNVEGRDISGAVDAEAGSGDIQIEAKGGGNMQVHTGSGNIDLRGVSGGLRAEAGSGDVTVSGIQTDAWEVRTGSGDVKLRLPANAAFDLDASTSSGSVVVGRPVSMTIQGDVERVHHKINGKVAGGGPLLTIHTGSGDVNID